jgi:hypothetical protein
MKHKEFTTRTELKSLTQSIKCVETDCGSLRMLSECLVDSSMRLGVPFKAQCCLRWRGAPARPGHHRTVTVAVWCAISFLFWRIRLLVLGGSWHTGQSGAPCRPLARPRVARRLRGRPLATVGSPDSLVNYSHVVFLLFPRATGSPWMTHRTVRCTTGQSGEL